MNWRNSIRQLNLGQKIALGFLTLIVVMAVAAPLVVLDSTSNANDMDLNRVLLGPGSKTDMGLHLFGTDKYGRDHFSRVILGSRISLTVGFIAVSISLFIVPLHTAFV